MKADLLCGVLGDGHRLVRGDRDAIIILTSSIIVVFFFLGSGFLGRGFLLFLKSHDWFATVADEVGQLQTQMLVPLLARRLQRVGRLTLLVEEGLRQAGGVAAVFELGCRHFRSLVEIAVSIKEFMDFVFDFGL